jgi:hypothetical protein
MTPEEIEPTVPVVPTDAVRADGGEGSLAG